MAYVPPKYVETDKYIYFCSHEAKYGFLSQWFQSNFDGYQFAEQAMMADKARLFGDDEILAQIMAATDPETIKNLGRKIKGFVQQTWDDMKYVIVLENNRCKFNQNPELKRKLLETGTKILVEAAHYDKVWGIGLRPEDAVKVSESEWKGENLLGKALMQVRDELKDEDKLYDAMEKLNF